MMPVQRVEFVWSLYKNCNNKWWMSFGLGFHISNYGISIEIGFLTVRINFGKID